MKVKITLQKNFDINGIIQKCQQSSFNLVRQSAKIVSSHIKEEMWRAKDTQTGFVRDREYTVGAIPATGTIIGSTTTEWPNIEKAFLVNGIYARGSDKLNDVAYIHSSAIHPDTGFQYAPTMDERNKFLRRGFNEKKLTIQNNIQQSYYLNKLK